MTKSRLYTTPMESMELKGLTAFLVKTVSWSARVFGFWKRPMTNAAADILDMRLIDKIYWTYKAVNPILQPEKGFPLKRVSSDGFSVQLPDEFEKGEGVTIGAVGDLIKVDGLENSKDFIYEKVADLVFENDIVYGNLESQLTEQVVEEMIFREDEAPELCCSPKEYAAMKSHQGKNYTVFHTACNHSLDKGIEGLETTLKQLQADQIIDIGTNRKPEDQYRAEIMDVKGVRIGFVSATFGLNGKSVPIGEEYRVNLTRIHNSEGPADVNLILKQIDHCRQEACDFIIASLHWGFEYEFFPRIDQVKTAHQLVETGVDAIISHHPHVVQPVELYRTKRDPDRLAVIAYSLGNLTSSYSGPQTALSQVLNLSLNKGTVKGQSRTYVDSCVVTPVVQLETENQGKPAIQPMKVVDVKRMTNCPLDRPYMDQINTYINLVQGEFRAD